jgi:hypothetical protein
MCVLRAKNKIQAISNEINKDVGKSLKYGKIIELNSGTKIIYNPQNVARYIKHFLVIN